MGGFRSWRSSRWASRQLLVLGCAPVGWIVRSRVISGVRASVGSYEAAWVKPERVLSLPPGAWFAWNGSSDQGRLLALRRDGRATRDRSLKNLPR